MMSIEYVAADLAEMDTDPVVEELAVEDKFVVENDKDDKFNDDDDAADDEEVRNLFEKFSTSASCSVSLASRKATELNNNLGIMMQKSKVEMEAKHLPMKLLTWLKADWKLLVLQRRNSKIIQSISM